METRNRSSTCLLLLTVFMSHCVFASGLSDAITPGRACRPKSCQCDVDLQLVNCSHRQLREIPGEFPASTLVLDLSSNLLQTIPEKNFMGLGNLTNLYLRNNNISYIHHSALQDLPNLRELDLSSNSLADLPAGLLQHGSALEMLHLNGNELTFEALRSIDYCNLTSLRELDISRNPLGKDLLLPEGFAFLTAIEQLVIRDANLNRVVKDSFIPLANCSLRNLSLASNYIVDIAPESFISLTAITELDMSLNSLPIVSVHNMFSDLRNSNLETLKMAYVFVRSDKHHAIDRHLFRSLSSTPLRVLSLKGSYGGFLESLSSSFFKHLEHLEELELQDCELREVSHDAFKGLTKLRVLNLSNNFLSCLRHKACGFMLNGVVLERLSSLDLSDNSLRDTVGGVKFHKKVFPNLQTLNLSGNKLLRLTHHMFGVDSLQGLYLSNNPLTEIKPGTFSSLKCLQTLHVKYSPFLTRLHAGTFKGLKVLQELNLEHNGLELLDEGAFRGLSQLRWLSLRHNSLGSNLDAISVPSTRLKAIDLGDNRISHFPLKLLSNHPNLTQLFLDNNRFSLITVDHLSHTKSLTLLNLSHNDIVSPSAEAFKMLTALKSLDVSYNPFMCGCALAEFTGWLNASQLSLHNEAHWTCSSPDEAFDTSIFHYRSNQWTCWQRHVTFSILIALTVLIFRQCRTHKNALSEDYMQPQDYSLCKKIRKTWIALKRCLGPKHTQDRMAALGEDLDEPEAESNTRHYTLPYSTEGALPIQNKNKPLSGCSYLGEMDPCDQNEIQRSYQI